MVVIGGLGAGPASLARPELGAGLARAFDQSACRFGGHTQRLEDWEIFFRDASSRSGAMRPGTSYSGVAVTRVGDALAGTPGDNLGHLEPQLLLEAGWTLAHDLMVLSSR